MSVTPDSDQHPLGEFFPPPTPPPVVVAEPTADIEQVAGAPPGRTTDRKEPRSRGGDLMGWMVTLVLLGAAVALIKWWGLSLNIVATDSMTPTYKPTDIVVMVSPERVQPEVGRVAVFETEYLGVHIPPHVHRIVERTPDQTWLTQGDNNDQPDPWEVRDQGIRGIVIAGFPSWWIRSPIVIGAAIFLLIVIGFWPRQDHEVDTPPEGGEHDAR